jgi:hypothetical protein
MRRESKNAPLYALLRDKNKSGMSIDAHPRFVFLSSLPPHITRPWG